MDFKEAEEIIKKTYVLTEREKKGFIEMAKSGNPTLTMILQNYKKTNNIHKFYDELKNANLLSTQKTYQVVSIAL